MEIRVLRYFVTMAREGNMTRAAERLFVTQPTLSKQLKDLEEELGRKLYERTNYSIRLTDAGIGICQDTSKKLVRSLFIPEEPQQGLCPYASLPQDIFLT